MAVFRKANPGTVLGNEMCENVPRKPSAPWELIDVTVSISPSNKLQERNKTFHSPTGSRKLFSPSRDASLQQGTATARCRCDPGEIRDFTGAWFSFCPPTVI